MESAGNVLIWMGLLWGENLKCWDSVDAIFFCRNGAVFTKVTY